MGWAGAVLPAAGLGCTGSWESPSRSKRSQTWKIPQREDETSEVCMWDKCVHGKKTKPTGSVNVFKCLQSASTSRRSWCVLTTHLVSRMRWQHCLFLFHFGRLDLFDRLLCCLLAGLTLKAPLNHGHPLQHGCPEDKIRFSPILVKNSHFSAPWPAPHHIKAQVSDWRWFHLLLTSCGHIFWRERCTPLPSAGAPRLCSCRRCWRHFGCGCRTNTSRETKTRLDFYLLSMFRSLWTPECKTHETQVSECFWTAGGPAGTRGFPYSTFSLMRVLSFMVAVRAKPLVVGDDMCDCRTVSKASRTLSSVTWGEDNMQSEHQH